MKTLAGTIAVVALTGMACAQPLPVPKPPGPAAAVRMATRRANRSNVPSASAQNAIPKLTNGTCP